MSHRLLRSRGKISGAEFRQLSRERRLYPGLYKIHERRYARRPVGFRTRGRGPSRVVHPVRRDFGSEILRDFSASIVRKRQERAARLEAERRHEKAREEFREDTSKALEPFLARIKEATEEIRSLREEAAGLEAKETDGINLGEKKELDAKIRRLLRRQVALLERGRRIAERARAVDFGLAERNLLHTLQGKAVVGRVNEPAYSKELSKAIEDLDELDRVIRPDVRDLR